MTTTVPVTQLIRAHFLQNIQQLARMPAYLVPTLAFPALFFAFFALPNGKSHQFANLFMGSYSMFAVLGVVIFQFGVGIAVERSVPWERYVRTLPVGASARLAARVLAALVFSGLAVAIIVVLAVSLTKVSVTPAQWLAFLLALFLGGVPFALLGIAIGYWVDARAAVPVANLVYLPLTYVGGLWAPPAFLPDALKPISPFLPTRAYGEIVWAALGPHAVPAWALVSLLLYTVAFAILAVVGYQRDEGARFR